MGVARGVLRTIRSAAGSERRRVVHECRRCGYTLDDTSEPCPSCGTDEVASYCF